MLDRARVLGYSRGMEFDMDSERCYECDGHWTHATWCSLFTQVSALTVEQRVEARAIAREIVGDSL